MNLKHISLFLAVAVLPAVGGQALARHVTHPVTPQNIDQQPFAFTVRAKDVGEFKEFEITVRQKAGKPAPVRTATGELVLDARGGKKAESPPVTRVLADGGQTYTFRVAPADLDRARFTFTETPEDVRVPFPFPGDYWVFDLGDFAGGAKK